MLLRLFKGNNLLIVVFALLLAAAMWIIPSASGQAFYQPGATDTPLMHWLFGLFREQVWGLKITGFTLVCLQLFIITRLNFQFIFIERKTQLFAFIYLLLISLIPFMQGLNGAQIGNVMFLLSIWWFFPIVKERNLIKKHYEAGFLLGIGGLFYLPTGLFLFIVWIAQFVMRNFNLREWFATIAGFITPSIFYFVILFLQGRQGVYLDFLQEFVSGQHADIQLAKAQWLGPFGIAFVLLLAIISITGFIGARKITTRKNFVMMLWITAWCLVIKSIFSFVGTEILYFVTFPVALILSHFFVELRRKWFGEILFMFFLFAAFYFYSVQL